MAQTPKQKDDGGTPIIRDIKPSEWGIHNKTDPKYLHMVIDN